MNKNTPPYQAPDGGPWLLTPGPLTTSTTVKQAMLRDYGSRDRSFIEINAAIRRRLVALANGGDDYVTVPLQGSGTFTVEAMLSTFVGRDNKLLLLVNGAYGRRMATISDRQGIACEVLEWPENRTVEVEALEQALAADPSLSHVAVVHCETTSGILNPVAALAECCARHRRALLIDAMSAFGALPLDVAALRPDAVAASANKCLEGVPGVGFCIARRAALADCKDNARALSLDLYDQWTAMEAGGQWRFTPPTHVLAALHQALDELDAEGGVAGRGARYRRNCETLINGMHKRGFHTLLDQRHQAPIIVTFLEPADPAFAFDRFYEGLRERGFVIYPGKLTVAATFRIGCIGRLGEQVMDGVLAAIDDILSELGVRNCAP